MSVIRTAEELVRRKSEQLFPGSPVDQAYFMGLARQESGFNPNAYNKKGDAYGLFQFAGEMRKAYGMDTNSPIGVQLEAGGDYLKKLYDKHAGNWEKVLAEHYMGMSRLRRSESGQSDAEVRSFYGSHLPKVIANAHKYLAASNETEATNITLPTQPVSSVDSASRIAQQAAQTPMYASGAPTPRRGTNRSDQLSMILGLMSSLGQANAQVGQGFPNVFGGKR